MTPGGEHGSVRNHDVSGNLCLPVCLQPPAAEDFSHLPPEQRKKKLQGKIDDINKELQKTQDQR